MGTGAPRLFEALTRDALSSASLGSESAASASSTAQTLPRKRSGGVPSTGPGAAALQAECEALLGFVDEEMPPRKAELLELRMAVHHAIDTRQLQRFEGRGATIQPTGAMGAAATGEAMGEAKTIAGEEGAAQLAETAPAPPPPPPPPATVADAPAGLETEVVALRGHEAEWLGLEHDVDALRAKLSERLGRLRSGAREMARLRRGCAKVARRLDLQPSCSRTRSLHPHTLNRTLAIALTLTSIAALTITLALALTLGLALSLRLIVTPQGGGVARGVDSTHLQQGAPGRRRACPQHTQRRRRRRRRRRCPDLEWCVGGAL